MGKQLSLLKVEDVSLVGRERLSRLVIQDIEQDLAVFFDEVIHKAQGLNKLKAVVRLPFQEYKVEVDKLAGVYRMQSSLDASELKIPESLKENMPTELDYLMDILMSFEVYWAYHNALNICIDGKSVDGLEFDPKSSFVKDTFELLDKSGISDVCVDFRNPDGTYANFNMRISKYDFDIVNNDGSVDTYYSASLCNVARMEKPMRVRNKKYWYTADNIGFDVLPRLYPRLTVSSSAMCPECNVKCIVSNKMARSDDFGSSELGLHICPLVKRTEGRCPITGTDRGAGDFDSVFAYAIFGLNRYLTRHERTKVKVSASPKARKVSNPAAIEVYNKDTDRMIELRDYVKYERQSKGYQGGHHASPVEHVRSGYYRHYKSGKVVYVEPTVINKGKSTSSSVYVVKGK